MLENIIPAAYAFNIPSIPIIEDVGLSEIITRIIKLILEVAGIIALLYLVFSGIQYITAGGDAEKATTARQGILNAVIGIVVILASIAIITFVLNKIGQGGFGGGGGTSTGGGGGGGGGTTLATPTGLSESQITGVSARVSWGQVGGATAYRVQWGQGGNFTGDSDQITTTFYNITALSPNQSYVWQVRAGNNTGGSSEWAGDNFTTTNIAL